jgi:hypothetical protein
VSPVDIAVQHAGNSAGNIRRFLRRDFHMKSGMKFLIQAFYDATQGKGALPIPLAEILRVSKTMNEIFARL